MKISVFQVYVHHLLGQRATLGCNVLIEKKLVLYFSDSRTLNCGGIGHNGIEVELLVVHLTSTPEAI